MAAPSYLDLKLARRCVRCRRDLTDAEAEVSDLCAPHLADKRARQAKSEKRARSARRRNGMCAECGAVKSKRYYCPGCLVKVGRTPKSSAVDNAVDKSARIAARTSRRNEGRDRYRGRPRRGRPSDVDEATLDRDDIIRLAHLWCDGIAYAKSPEVQALPRIQRRDALEAAIDHARHGIRFWTAAIERHGRKL